MRLREVWARSACDVSVLDAGLGQRRGSLARTQCDAPVYVGNGIGDRAAILGVFKPVRLPPGRLVTSLSEACLNSCVKSGLRITRFAVNVSS